MSGSRTRRDGFCSDCWREDKHLGPHDQRKRMYVVCGEYRFPLTLDGLTAAIEQACAEATSEPVPVMKVDGDVITVARTVPVQPRKNKRTREEGWN